MDLSIIIPTFNTKDLLDRCLQSVYQSLKSVQFSWEIIVIDNASRDGTTTLLKSKYTRVKRIFNTSNVGYGRANNQGIKLSKGTTILLLNTDIIAIGNSIKQMYEFSLEHPLSFVGGKLFNEDMTPQASCGPMVDIPIVLAMLFLQGDILGISRYSPQKTQNVDWVSGACLISLKKNFKAIGLFDEHIFMYMEEIDLLYRAKRKGFTTLFYPHATFIHTGAASSADAKTPVKNIYSGLVYFYKKHRSLLEIQLVEIMLRVKAYIAIGVGFLVGDPRLRRTYEEALGMVTQ